MLPEMKMNAADYSSFDSIFVGAFLYAMENNMSLDDGIKLANTAGAISISKLGEVDSIPTLDEVLDNSGLREKLLSYRKEAVSPAQAAEVTPLNPGYSSTQQANNESSALPEQNNVQAPTPVIDNGMNVAFGAAPVVNPEPAPVALQSQVQGTSEQAPVMQQMNRQPDFSSQPFIIQNQTTGQNEQVQ